MTVRNPHIPHPQGFCPRYAGVSRQGLKGSRTKEDREILARHFNKIYMMEWVSIAERYEWAEYAPDTGTSAAAKWAASLNL